ncbi:hypothetical protein CsSME_00007985 [Camellia sinensis var. sinensis]
MLLSISMWYFNWFSKVSRQEYLKKMEQKKLKELRDDIEDEQYLFDGVKLTKAEYGELSCPLSSSPFEMKQRYSPGLITAIIPSKLYFILLLIGSDWRGAVAAVVCSLVLVLVKRCYCYFIVAATGSYLLTTSKRMGIMIGCQCWSLVGKRVEMKLAGMDYVAIGCCSAGCDTAHGWVYMVLCWLLSLWLHLCGFAGAAAYCLLELVEVPVVESGGRKTIGNISIRHVQFLLIAPEIYKNYRLVDELFHVLPLIPVLDLLDY